MIASLTGSLQHVDDDRIHLQVGPILYELLVPAADITRLKDDVGLEMTFHTLLYLQGDANGGNLEPRLIGFLRREDKKFFEKFITVKGIGPKKALKALALPVGEIAHAIESKDAKFLVELPEIGKRTAETIIAELSGKVKEFASSIPESAAMSLGGSRRTSVEEDAIHALIALGERRIDAEHLLDRARQLTPDARTTNDLLREMLRMRSMRV
ncbi:MAG: holliday junction helicase RuvA [Phycisphaerales bacterium]|jgi:Holliday junction DNA helicase RuvA|nr:holliday junction helicase RuvA [Phycisphaerales bacterium]